jgi:hypothetical protein
VELIDARGITSGPQSIGSHTTDVPQAPDVWEFFPTCATFNFQTVNRFYYTGAGSYVLNYDHVEAYIDNIKSPQVMADVENEFGDQVTWGYATPSEPMQAFTITIPSITLLKFRKRGGGGPMAPKEEEIQQHGIF